MNAACHVETELKIVQLEHGTGGVGHLLKDRLSDTARLIDAVRLIAAGGTVLDSEVVPHMLGRHRRNRTLDRLTERDLEVLAFDKLGITASRRDHRRVLAVLAYLHAT